MHTVDIMDEALCLAKRIGYRIRQEWLGGSGGGGCEIRGQKFLFLDLSLGPDDQLELVLDALKNDPDTLEAEVPATLTTLLRASTHKKQSFNSADSGHIVPALSNNMGLQTQAASVKEPAAEGQLPSQDELCRLRQVFPRMLGADGRLPKAS